MFFPFLPRLKNASFEIVPADSGVFEVSAKFMGIPMEKVEIVFQVCLFVSRKIAMYFHCYEDLVVQINIIHHIQYIIIIYIYIYICIGYHMKAR